MSEKYFTFITGATGGLGKCFCEKLASDGQNLFITGRSDEKLHTLCKNLKDKYANIDILYFACDLVNEKERGDLFDYCIRNNLYFNQLINVAGADIQKEFLKYTQEKIIFQSRILFESTVCLTRFALSRKCDSLKILTISSLCGTLPIPYFAIYSSLKGALIQFFDCLRYELKNDKNIVITTILPGSIPTRADIIEDIKKQGLTGKLSKKSPEFIVRKSLNALRKRKKNYIPGFYNKTVNFFQNITPKFIKVKIIARQFAKKEKDAF